MAVKSVSVESGRIIIRCRPRTFWLTWASVFACIALLGAFGYENPAYAARVYGLIKRGVLSSEFSQRLLGKWLIMGPIVNRKGLGVPNDYYAGRNPVNMQLGQDSVMDYTGESFVRLFRRMDANDDGVLDPDEFGQMMQRLHPVKFHQSRTEYPVADNEESLELECQFDPIHLDTITKDLRPGKASNTHYLSGLFNWTQPRSRRLRLPQSLLVEGFSPPKNFTVGQVFYLVDRPPVATQSGMQIRDEFDYQNAHSVNRYYPPEYRGAGAKAIAAVLSLLHERVFASTRHPPHSSAAVVKSVGDNFVEIVARLHAEFQLNLPPLPPFWFTPSYFFGSVRFTRDLKRVVGLDIDLPSDKKLNIDMEWMQSGISGDPDEQIVEVDIGHSDSMRIRGGVADTQPQAGKVEQAISTDRAFALLEVELYPFKKVPYHPFPAAFNLSREEGKLVHSVVLWGSLDDQSC